MLEYKGEIFFMFDKFIKKTSQTKLFPILNYAFDFFTKTEEASLRISRVPRITNQPRANPIRIGAYSLR